MIAFPLIRVIVAMVLGIVGVVVKGLLDPLFIGIAVFLGAFLLLRSGDAAVPGAPRQVSSHQPSRGRRGLRG